MKGYGSLIYITSQIAKQSQSIKLKLFKSKPSITDMMEYSLELFQRYYSLDNHNHGKFKRWFSRGLHKINSSRCQKVSPIYVKCHQAPCHCLLSVKCCSWNLSSGLRMVCVIWESLLRLSFECQEEQANTDMYFVYCKIIPFMSEIKQFLFDPDTMNDMCSEDI